MTHRIFDDPRYRGDPSGLVECAGDHSHSEMRYFQRRRELAGKAQPELVTIGQDENEPLLDRAAALDLAGFRVGRMTWDSAGLQSFEVTVEGERHTVSRPPETAPRERKANPEDLHRK